MMQQNKQRKSIAVFLSLMTAIVLQLPSSCKSNPDPSPEPVILPPAKKTEYLKLLPETAHNINLTAMSDAYHYLITTTEHDPYISTGKLVKAVPPDSVMLCFEYKSGRELEFIQVFFAEPIAEKRSMKSERVPAAASWTEWSLNVKKAINENSWGNSGQYLRLDFGNDAGYSIELRNIHFRGMTPDERAEEAAKEAKIASEKQFAENIRKYLDTKYPSSVTDVNVGENTVAIAGNCVGEGSFALCEITPWMDVTQRDASAWSRPLTSAAFSETVERYVERDGIRYDRALSKWAIIRTDAGENAASTVSHARYADQVYAVQATVQEKPASKKGLGGCFNHSLQQQDMDDLGITSATVNIPVTAFMRSSGNVNSIEHRYGGKSYYFDRNQINDMDETLKGCARRNIVVAAIILIQPAASCPDKKIGELLQHPDFAGGFYTMPNMTNPESVNTYAAALDFLATRYCRPDKQFGRIHHWIMHNEVDAGVEWTNMGYDKQMLTYTDAYMKSMRMCYNIARRYDRHTEVFGSFTHSWKTTDMVSAYASLDMLNAFNDYCRAEGDFRWALAYHCYPQDLNEPKTWNDAAATYSTASAMITFKNLEVLDHWAKQSENKYKGTEKRTVWLSENGTNSRTYGETDLLEQAAGFAWGWKKLSRLDGIDAIQWHNWADNEAEFGLRIGLRKFPSNGLEPKEVWYVYQAAGTPNEDNLFRKYLSVIGIPDWNILRDIY
jgi:hypothetical protein